MAGNTVNNVTGYGESRIHIGDWICNIDDLPTLLRQLGHFLKTEPVDAFLRLLEIVELLLSFTTIIVTGSAATGMVSSLRWSGPPGKLIYNIILAAFTFAGLAISILRWRSPNNPLISLAINAIAMATWIAASACAFYQCNDICGVARPKYSQWRYAGICCDCSERSGLQLFDCSLFDPAGPGFPAEQRLDLYELTQKLDIAIAVFFGIATLVWTARLCKGASR